MSQAFKVRGANAPVFRVVKDVCVGHTAPRIIRPESYLKEARNIARFFCFASRDCGVAAALARFG
jgi:hypothetical protein